MKIFVKYIKHLFNQKHHAELTLLVENYRETQWLSELDPDKIYAVEIKERKSKRSLQQNKYLWALLHELETVSKIDVMNWYCFALETTGAKFEYILGKDEIRDNLVDAFRGVQKIGKRVVNGNELTVFKCFYGSSKFTVAEMQMLIDKVIEYCHEHNIETEEKYYE